MPEDDDAVQALYQKGCVISAEQAAELLERPWYIF